ncbi:phosphoesterase [soil metagenome]
MDERVLVIPESHFQAVGGFEGFRPDSDNYAERLLDTTQYSFRPRSSCETDPTFKQLIPYILLTCGDLAFHYRRGSKGTEKRLAALRSLGIGGHISEADARGDGNLYENGLARELDEEVSHAAIARRELLGFIYDPRTPVGTVHLGIVHRFELAEAVAASKEDALIDAGWSPLNELAAASAEFETWSQLVLEQIC